MKLLDSKRGMYFLMAVLVVLWGIEYIAAKNALEAFSPLSLVFLKYLIGLVLMLALKTVIDRRFPLRIKDIPLLLVCTLVGDIFYFAGEYSAMSYLPVSVITIILAFVPCVSILLEFIVFKRRPSAPMVVGVLVCVAGVALVIGADIGELFSGKYIGYLLAFGVVFCWNAYNFITEKLVGGYKPLDLALYQQVCAVLMAAPVALYNMPHLSTLDTSVWVGVLYLGCVSAFVGFLIYVKAIDVIGPTPCALYSNFVPVTATLFGWWFLGEMISGLQILGGIIIISFGVMVIKQKEKLG